MIFYNYLKLK